MTHIAVEIMQYTGLSEFHIIPNPKRIAPRLAAEQWLRQKGWFDAVVVMAQPTDKALTVSA